MATYTSNTSNGYKLILEVNQASQDKVNNKSTVSWTLKMSCAAQYYQNQNTKDSFYVAINGSAVYNTTKAIYFSGSNTTVTVASGSVTVTHNADGSKSVPVSFSYYPAKTASYYPGSMSGSGTLTLTTIPRQATLTAAPHFTDEDNPTITYSNPAGEVVTSLKACIADANGQNLYAEYRDIPKTGTSYTFNLKDEERNALRWASINSPNLTVRFYVTTVIGGVTYYSTLDKIMTITNAQPTISATIKDVGTASTLLTGDENKIIKGLNYITASMTATAYKGASIKKQTIECGGITINGSGVFENVESATFIVTATDSRGYTTTQTINKTLIDYIKLTCNLVAGKPNAQGKMSIRINGNYFNGSFGAVTNTLQVQFRYKTDNEEYSEWIDAAPNISGNTYETTVEVTGLDYKQAYTFQARAVDKALSIPSAEKRVKAIPVYDWGENDFNFNVPVSFEGKNLVDVIYPIGSIYMNVTYIEPSTLFPGTEWERLMDRFLLGSGAIYAQGNTGGEAEHTLTFDEMPAHTHDTTALNKNDAGSLPYNNNEDANCVINYNAAVYPMDTKGWSNRLAMVKAGNSQPHNNMPPYLVVNMWKRIG